jgi:hypothetical protein
MNHLETRGYCTDSWSLSQTDASNRTHPIRSNLLKYGDFYVHCSKNEPWQETSFLGSHPHPACGASSDFAGKVIEGWIEVSDNEAII